MTAIDFVKNYDGKRIERDYVLPAQFENANGADVNDPEAEEGESRFALGIEMDEKDWRAVKPQLPEKWRLRDFAARPVQFVDGKDVGQTVACLRGLSGYLVPVRLAQIGGVLMRVNGDGELRREFVQMERVVAMDTSPFPWEEVEIFARALGERGFRLLPAKKLDEELSFDFEQMRRAAIRRTAQEMSVLEEFAVAQNNQTPTIVDGNLKSHEGGFDTTESPVFGLVKTYRKTHLHRLGQQVLYALGTGERTPAFSFEYDVSGRGAAQRKSRLPILAWYVRICTGEGSSPNLGLVRVEISQSWFAAQGFGSSATNPKGVDFINQLSRTIFEYRCRKAGYSRKEISLQPIVRAEESLGALLAPRNSLQNNFYRATGL